MFDVALAVAATRRRVGQPGSRFARLEGALLLVSLAAAVAYLMAQPWLAPSGKLVIKALAIAPLVVMPLLVPMVPRRGLLALALLASLVGDLCLVFQGATWFLRGLVAFLMTHLLYIYLFSRRVRQPLRLTAGEILGASLLLAAALSALTGLWPGLGKLRLPVLVYAAALTAMNISALLARLPAVFAGTMLFLLSDMLLGVSVFRGAPTGARPVIWATYYAAQLLIVSGYLARVPPRVNAGAGRPT